MSTQLSTLSSTDFIQKAWHMAAVLLSVGKPLTPPELAGECSLFDSSPEFVEFLCSVPGSPLHLAGNGAVVLSVEVFRAVGDFVRGWMPRMLRFGGVRTVYLRKRKRGGTGVALSGKRRAIIRSINGNEETESDYFKVDDLQTAYLGRTLNALPFCLMSKAINSGNFSDIALAPSVTNYDVGLLEYQSENNEEQKGGQKQITSLVNDTLDCEVMERRQGECYYDEGMTFDTLDCNKVNSKVLLQESLAEVSAMLGINEVDSRSVISKMASGGPSCAELDQPIRITSAEAASVINVPEELINTQLLENKMEEMAQLLIDSGAAGEKVEHLSVGVYTMGVPLEDKTCQTKAESPMHETPTLQEEQPNNKSRSQPLGHANPQSDLQKSLTKSSAIVKNVPQHELTHKQQTKLQQQNMVDIAGKERRDYKDQKTIAMKDKSKLFARKGALQEKVVPKLSKDQPMAKYPEFESYTVEEEEGSGGYGTVYRARRKSDGITFAIKYPHAKAHQHHIKNELKMLERFGGRSFVIKYEGSFKSGNADCFVLEHVEHDRPEVLKRDMEINQLQWYGFCLFKALTSLHRQGVFHRDVKPGNFLFSCKSNKGYLIDFNLAKDLYPKHGNTDKSQPGYVTAVQHVPAPQSKSASPSKRRKVQGGKSLEVSKTGTPSGINRTLESKTLKKKALDKLKAYDDLGRRNPITSQGADGSGLTSKDITSTRTPSGERLREPVPCQGRKELINFAQAAMQSSNLGAASAPTSKRKRVAASPGIMDKNYIYLTPTPLHSSGIAISGAGSMKNGAEVKPHKEGPCVGTKGFRAPEVLLRSLYQGPKIDVWSAGVTLLYLITGKMPFTGDPEQNMKDIVKLKGNEELWEVAKLHNRESSFPRELLDIGYLKSMTLKDWCVANTKRPDFLELLPSSIFDLVERCLAVNPRLRISSEDALMHEFFAPCHAALQRHRSRRQGLNQELRSNSLNVIHESVGPSYKQLITPVNL